MFEIKHLMILFVIPQTLSLPYLKKDTFYDFFDHFLEYLIGVTST